ncbi:MAG: hypothetical protein WBM44_04885 [Waterburya sp.]
MPEFSCSDTAIAKKKGDEHPTKRRKPPREAGQRTTGTETNQTDPETEHQPGRTHTTQPTKRETTKAKALLTRTGGKTAPDNRPRIIQPVAIMGKLCDVYPNRSRLRTRGRWIRFPLWGGGGKL